MLLPFAFEALISRLGLYYHCPNEELAIQSGRNKQ